MKLCVNCKWYHPHNNCLRIPNVSPINGDDRIPQTCFTERYSPYSFDCGPDARFFEEKEKETKE